MTSFNESLEVSLAKLYEKSPTFNVSIELIQKLARHLKFETFVDTDVSFSNSLTKLKGSTDKHARLSIAGTRLLIDIDFTDDKNIIRVGISLASRKSSEENDHEMPLAELDLYISRSENNGTKVITLDLTKEHAYSITLGDFNENGIEKLLFNNLNQLKLNTFPENLKFISNLDRLSSSSLDLFHYFNSLVLLFHVIHKIELEKQPGNWQVEKGYASKIGKPSSNNVKTNELGLFITYWKDLRYLDHEASLSDDEYTFELYIDETTREPIDYLEEQKYNDWILDDDQNQPIKYKFGFQDGTQLLPPNSSDSSESSTETKRWSIYLKLNKPVYVPASSIELLGLVNYLTVSPEKDEVYNLLQQDEAMISFDLDKPTKLTFKQQLAHKMIALKSLELNHLSDITNLVAILRNQIILTNIIRSSLKHHSVTQGFEIKTEHGISTRSTELSAEAKKKLKESLKLPDDVTEEALLGLGAVSENANYTNNKIINPKEIDVETFMTELNDNEDSSGKEDPGIELVWEDIEYQSENKDLTFKLKGINGTLRFRISNGEIRLIPQDDDIEMKGSEESNDEFHKKVIKGLNVSEDLVESLHFAYT
ncbi:hypothetical protein HYPBUDRAFT_182702 [Hyphopichia burtonii NRRL Y-1933]|uniref:Mediator of RNA polymerase II transcription subunit 1 n=1 Tax=Hyphopichia burtonii NRRL Y-1933 TaxID=984485 RepID=A0A1E4RT93_9ASCO|nr:hypothetical protein HYPBUDRAFT_182702 [Hyphopichia burtonii NRRL Y-1933]ODV70514.1 hypothetical protein HYPBUDRAFT_182702 [Hyphopichia burtonii NRRL Y-1933]